MHFNRFRFPALIIILGMAVLFGCESGIIKPDSDIQPPDYSDRDAVYLTYSLKISLLPDPALYNKIHGDLDAIREFLPDMKRIHHHSGFKAGHMSVYLNEEAAEQYEAGVYRGLDSLNNLYGPPANQFYDERFKALHYIFDLPYHPEKLVEIYELAQGVERARGEPNFGDGSRITVAFPKYDFSFGWGDCPAGCIYRHYWHFEVIAGRATLLSESGDSLPPHFWPL